MTNKPSKRVSTRAHSNRSVQTNIITATIVNSGSYNATVAASGATQTYVNLQASGDFVSFATLYREYRVTRIQVQFLDLQPGTPIPALIGMAHCGGTLAPNTVAYVQDLPNSQNVKPYQQHNLIWRPTNPAERLFVDTSSSADYGGFYFQSLGGAAVTAKWRYLIRFTVEFKDRL